ncbi:MAG: response regulator transcription factor [Chloroflexota bacterium]
MIRLLIVDDHPVVLGGLRGALAGNAAISEIVVAGSRREALEILHSGRLFDVALVDIRLADGSGLDLMETDGVPAPPAWIVLTSFDTPQYVAAALDLGAAGFVLKTAPLAEVTDAIERVARGGTAFESHHLAAGRELRRHRLTARERQLVDRVVAGRSNDEIAMDLHLARKTVEAYLSRLYDRFDVSGRTELAIRAEREGWLVDGAR